MVTVSGQGISKTQLPEVACCSEFIDHSSDGLDWGGRLQMKMSPDSVVPRAGPLPSFTRLNHLVLVSRKHVHKESCSHWKITFRVKASALNSWSQRLASSVSWDMKTKSMAVSCPMVSFTNLEQVPGGPLKGGYCERLCVLCKNSLIHPDSPKLVSIRIGCYSIDMSLMLNGPKILRSLWKPHLYL